MNLVIHPVNVDASAHLTDFITKKMLKLETYFSPIMRTEVFLKTDTNDRIKDKIVEIKVHIPGKTLFVSECTKSFEECVDLALARAGRLLVKNKEKMKAI